jgi:hypothetical protein
MTDRGRTGLTATLVALPVYGALVARFNFVCDDAYISFRYARNLADGLGLRYNPGVEPPVEGYSNFLWVLVMALVEKLGADPGTAARAISAACGAVLVGWVAALVARRVSSASPVPMAAALVLATLPPVSVWATGGLATLPFALTVFACFERLLGDPERPRGVQAGVLALTAALLRTDGAYWGVLILGVAGATWLVHRSPRLLRAIAIAGAILVAGVAAHVAWRYSYHGDWISNTARVKVGLSAFTLRRGLDYVASAAISIGSIGVLLAASPWSIGGRCRRFALQVSAIVAGTFAYAVLVGGDFMTMGRLLVPAMPFLALTGALVVERAVGAERWGKGWAWAIVAALVALSLLPSFNLHPVPRVVREAVDFRWNLPGYVTEYERWRGMRGNAARWAILGRALARHARADESLVSDAIGAVGYYSGLFIHDQYGLVDREVARREVDPGRRSAGHDKFVEPEFFLDRRPTYLEAGLVLPGGDRGAGADGRDLPDGYELALLPLDPADGFPDRWTLRVIRRGAP